MLELVSLEVKCPHCQSDLMDKTKKVDNKPGIKLKISVASKTGNIWLSSIYGSYNYEADIEIPENEIASFVCPHCEKELIDEENCSSCGAPTIPFHLLEGGKVQICSRAGCKKHLIEIEDIETAMNHFYRDFSFKGKSSLPTNHTTTIHRKKKNEDREIIATGTYLHSFCPHCKTSLIENNMLKFKISKENDEEGVLLLSPYFNVFSHKSTIRLPENKSVRDIKCWHCDKSLMIPEKNCPKCGSEVAKMSVAAMSKMIDFYICSKKGCTWHGLSDEDVKFIMFEDSEEW